MLAGMANANPLYRSIDFCSSPRALFGKLDSGRWDWLGVDTRRNFVLGSPRIKRSQMHAAPMVRRAGVTSDEHRIVVRFPHPTFKGWSGTEYATADEAREAWPGTLGKLRTSSEGQPAIWKARLFCAAMLEAEEYVVARPTTYR
jgi:hypothetical protein